MKALKQLLKNNNEKKKWQQQLELIRRSDYFDASYYLQQNPDVAAAGLDAAEHFLKYGGFEGRKPSGRFDPDFYLQQNEDVAESGSNPLLHFLRYGLQENREPLPAESDNTAAEEKDLAHASIDSGIQLLQLKLLQADYEGFDQLIELLQHNQLVNSSKRDITFQSLQLERWLASGDLAVCKAWLKAQQDHPYYWFYQARLLLLQGKNQAALAAVQSFLYNQPKSAEGHYLLADCATNFDTPDSARQSLSLFVMQSRRARSWPQLAQLVQQAEDLEHYLASLRQWCLEKPNAKYNPDISQATADAAIRGGNPALAKQALHDCIAFHQARKNGFKLLQLKELRFSQHPNLPLWPQPFQDLPQDKVLDCQQRMQQALRDLYAALQTQASQPFLLQQSLQACLLDAHFANGQPLTLGLSPQADVAAMIQALQSSGSFLLSEQTAQQLRIKHSNGIALVLYYHQLKGDGWQYSDHGVCWQTPAVHTMAKSLGDFSVQVPTEPEQYLAGYTPHWQQTQLDWVVQSSNRQVQDADRYSIYCYQQLLQALMAEDTYTEVLMLRELTQYESKQSYQQLVGSNYCIPTLEQLKSHGVKVVLYVSGLENVGYQANMWIPVLERMSVKCAIVIREKFIANELEPTHLPIYLMRTLRDIELLEEAGVKTILYPANPQKNVQALRLHRLNHYFINHGESDKVVNQSKFLMAYDKLLVAGPLAEKRIHDAGLPVRKNQIQHVGRPQVELMLTRGDGVCRPIKTILYAPTWEGFVEEANYSSVNKFGYQMLLKLLQHGGYKILFKPHPYTGYNKSGDCGTYLEKMKALSAIYSELTLVDLNSGIHQWMNASDLLITDISSVLNEYLYTLKPILLMNPKGFTAEELEVQFPSSKAAYIFNDEDDICSLLDSLTVQDTKVHAREQACAHSLGKFPNGSLVRFDEVIRESCGQATEDGEAVDIVITWVDGDDPKLIASRELYLNKQPGIESAAKAKRRFEDGKELLYCLKLIEINAAWVRKVWIITDNQRPSILDSQILKDVKLDIEVIDHKVIFAGYEHLLPVFNSLSIETMMWRIPGLQENFIYFNDDVFLINKSQKSDFFKDGKVYLRGTWVNWEHPRKNKFHGENALRGVSLASFDEDKYFAAAHVAHPMLKSICAELFEKNIKAFEDNAGYRFRSREQFWLVSAHNHEAFQKGKCLIYNDDFQDWKNFTVRFCRENNKVQVEEGFQRIINSSVKLLCINNVSGLIRKGVDVHGFLGLFLNKK